MLKKPFKKEWPQLHKGLALENEGKLDEAFNAYKKVADTGSAEGRGAAMFFIGNLYCYKNYQAITLPSLMPWGRTRSCPT